MKIIQTTQASGRYHYDPWDPTKYEDFTVHTYRRPAGKCILEEMRDAGYTRCYYLDNWNEGNWDKDWSNDTEKDDRFIVTRVAFFK